NTYQLSTKKEYAPYIKKVFDIKRKTPLSQAALEVLAVVAYNQPVTKAFIEQVRGVDCSAVITTLTEKELIEERGRLELPGRPLLYGTTKNFLRCFGVSDLSELPQLPNENANEVDLAEQLEVEDLTESDEKE
ncbi:MAG: SMC-Scp complex subunit ScpB, partial [Clostridia bacterium]|nr:SMC-Scp complex subunit ScpB [Clostridia bacterium]